jgi:hypothetical protein
MRKERGNYGRREQLEATKNPASLNTNVCMVEETKSG